MTEKVALPRGISRQRMVQYFFIAAFLFLAWQFLRLLAPFSSALLGSAILALLVFPLHEKLARRLKYPSLAAGLSTALTALVVIGPLLSLAWISAKETARVYPVASRWVADMRSKYGSAPVQWLPERFRAAARNAQNYLEHTQLQPDDLLLNGLNAASQQITRFAGSAIRNVLTMVFNLIVLVFTLFFFLRDGPYVLRRGIELIPMAASHKAAVLERLKITLFAVIRGVFAVAVLQGLLATLGFALFGVPFPALLGLLITFFGVVPFVGPASVWVPVALGMFLSGDTQNAVFMAIWGLCVVSAVDNFLRPLFISADAKLPMLLIFFGMIGGMRVFGFSGILLGPVTIALFLAFVSIYRREYQWLLNPSENAV